MTRLKTLGPTEAVRIQGMRQTLLARIDTGAAYSSITVQRKAFVDGNIYFSIMDGEVERWYSSSSWHTKNIKNSLGSEPRHIVQLAIMIAGMKFEIEFSLADRSKLKYPVLIGRNLICNNFIVNPSKK